MTEDIRQHSGKKYLRTIRSAIDHTRSIEVDVYNVIEAFGVTCPARAHAVKKLLCAGSRGKGSEEKDLSETIDALSRSLQLLRGRSLPKEEECPPLPLRTSGLQVTSLSE
jgi:hypothetical protein